MIGLERQDAGRPQLLVKFFGSQTSTVPSVPAGAFPPIKVFQQGDNLVAILEMPGVNKSELEIQAKGITIHVSGKKAIAYREGVSVHRRERRWGSFDRSLTVPMEINTDAVKAELSRRHSCAFHPTGEER